MQKNILINIFKRDKKVVLEKVSKINRKYIYIVLGVIVALLVLAYILVSVYYKKHFYNNTIINGIDASNKTVQQLEEAINEKVKTYSLKLEERNQVSESIKGQDIDMRIALEKSLEDIMAEQKHSSWFISLFIKNGLDINDTITYDENKLKDQFDNLKCFDKANVVEPTNAYISEYGSKGYEIVPENLGMKVKADVLYDAIKKAVTDLETSLSLEKIKCYEEPEITAKSPKLEEAIKKLNKIAASKITYKFGDKKEIVDAKRISKWLSVTDDYQVKLKEDGIKEFVDYIGSTYNTFGKTRTFKTTYGKEVQIKKGDYGWWLNRGKEVTELKELILAGSQKEKKPSYLQTAQQYGEDDIGDTYVEINLTAQHLYFYKDGSLVVESDFVSGNVSKNFGTPVGTYPVQYKEEDATLKGEDYSSDVKYWMPFNKNVGMHDATWRNEFGKDIYLTNGSHGCINLPFDAAQKIFKNISKGVAVVVYKLPGTENYNTEKNDINSPNGLFGF